MSSGKRARPRSMSTILISDMGCLLERLPISVSIVAEVKGAVDKTEFEQDAPPGGFRHFDESERKKKHIRTRFDRGRGRDRARHRISGARS
ncbi:hypothetical protein [Bradyrhizobium canariense]|uniref:hypothetical protein n=1 Tax=Bradyrhizobium canariense TaxID=255045 RepID=UPI001177EC63|nr:hypothetical protein [Bradyrhizobium canariense]